MALSPGTARPGLTLVDYLLPTPSSRALAFVRDVLLIIGFAIFLALCAQISFNLPFTPVPITLQTLAVLLTGAALGSKRGASSMVVYIVAGALGAPVFAGGLSGVAWLLGPTGGYIWSFPVAAFVVGLLCERRLERRFLTSILVMLPGTLIIYAIGVTQLAFVLHISVGKALQLGMLPFLPGDILKIVVAAILLPLAWTLVRRARPERE
jgi:biotin transport system substrate-specific component